MFTRKKLFYQDRHTFSHNNIFFSQFLPIYVVLTFSSARVKILDKNETETSFETK